LRLRQIISRVRIVVMPIHRLSWAQFQSKMEPLRHWHPQIDESRFHQGAISGEMWTYFEQFVQLCHAYRHWQQVSLKMRFPPPRQFDDLESKYSRKKHRDEWKSEVHRSEGHMYGAARLAAGVMAEMSRLIGNVDQDRPDCKLYSALRLAVASFSKPERGRFSAAAFRAFDADRELQGKSDEIASRWLRQAGYRGTAARIDTSLQPARPATQASAVT
jgi:hypothetical protein